MILTRNRTNAGASMFMAVPTMVWFAEKLMAATPKSNENTAPEKATDTQAAPLPEGAVSGKVADIRSAVKGGETLKIPSFSL